MREILSRAHRLCLSIFRHVSMHTASSEDCVLREARSLTIALEETAEAHALGMIAMETGMDSVDPLKCVGGPRRRQCVWSEPTAQIEKNSHNAQKNNANAAQPYQSAAAGQRRGLLVC